MQPFVSDPMALFKDLKNYDDVDDISYSIVKSVTHVSSEDNEHQTKDKVLDPSERSFWSSSGSSDPNSSETITLSLHSTSVISKVVITPYKASYQAL